MGEHLQQHSCLKLKLGCVCEHIVSETLLQKECLFSHGSAEVKRMHQCTSSACAMGESACMAATGGVQKV